MYFIRLSKMLPIYTYKVHMVLKPMCFYFIKVVLIKKCFYNVKKNIHLIWLKFKNNDVDIIIPWNYKTSIIFARTYKNITTYDKTTFRL